jgi:hypothetical protein
MHNAGSGKLLTDSLTDAGLLFELCETESQQPYVGFRIEVDPSEFVGVTAVIRNNDLQFIAHDVLRHPASSSLLRALNNINRDWALGHVSYNCTRSCVDASMALHFGERQPDRYSVQQAIRNLRLCVWNLRHSPNFGSDFGLYEQQLLDVAPVENGGDISDVQRTLTNIWQPFSWSRNGRILTQQFQLAATIAYVVELFKQDSKFLCVRARLLQGHRHNENDLLQKLQEINCRLAHGAAIAVPERLSFYFMMFPLSWIELDANFCSWLLDYISVAMEFHWSLGL